MKQDLNPCAKCGGVATMRGEAGIAVAACTQCGQTVGPFEAEDAERAEAIVAKAWNGRNPRAGGAP